jgi:small subunit ribosomal protein S2
VDVNREINALREARSLGIPTVCLIDSDGDPDMCDIAVPGNDDSMRSIEVIVREVAEAIKQGKAGRTAAAEGADEQQAAASTRRRSTRSQFRAADTTAPAPEIITGEETGEPVSSAADQSEF